MTKVLQLKHFVILVFILFIGLGLAVALPWLASTHNTAAQHSNPPSSSDDICFVKNKNSLADYGSTDAGAVQKAVDEASPGDVLLVAGDCVGIATRTGLIQTVYISKSLTLEGGYAPGDWTVERDLETYTTTLDADSGGRVVVISGTAGVIMDGLYLTGGLVDDGTLDDNGAGIWSNSGMTLANSIVSTNTAYKNGGGMYNLGISPTLTNVTFSHNSAYNSGGAMYNDGSNGASNPELKNVTFSGNSADDYGGAMYNDGWQGESSPRLTKVIFTDNRGFWGGAMFNNGYDGSSSPILTNVLFSGNSADYGGAQYNKGESSGSSSPELTNVVFSGNYAIGQGGAIYNDGRNSGSSVPVLTNVTFSGNFVDGEGAAIYNFIMGGGICSPDVRNTVMWNNRDRFYTGTVSATIFNKNSTVTLTHSLVQDVYSSGSWVGGSYKDGGGNLDDDPLFIEPISPTSAPTVTGNLRLGAGSPAINAGKNDFVSSLTTDLDGNPRIAAVLVDMGAYEAQGYHQLAVSISGSGGGIVTSLPPGINCGSNCSMPVKAGDKVTLFAKPNKDSLFTGWSEDCSKIKSWDCDVILDADKSVTATFRPALSSYLPMVKR
jgi:predicted outer membrane repeat protein